MAEIRYILLSCLLVSFANTIFSQSTSLLSIGSTNGREVPLETVVMPSSQREYVIGNLEKSCESSKVIGLSVQVSQDYGSVSVSTLEPLGAKIVRSGEGSDVKIDTIVYCS